MLWMIPSAATLSKQTATVNAPISSNSICFKKKLKIAFIQSCSDSKCYKDLYET